DLRQRAGLRAIREVATSGGVSVAAAGRRITVVAHLARAHVRVELQLRKERLLTGGLTGEAAATDRLAANRGLGSGSQVSDRVRFAPAARQADQGNRNDRHPPKSPETDLERP